jgi:hypothetical protein
MREEYQNELKALVSLVNNQWDEIVKHKEVFNKGESFISRLKQRKADAKFKTAVAELMNANAEIISKIEWNSDSDTFANETVRALYALRIQQKLTESVLKGITLFLSNGEANA